MVDGHWADKAFWGIVSVFGVARGTARLPENNLALQMYNRKNSNRNHSRTGKDSNLYIVAVINSTSKG